ncbi:Crp/Fnr family transcriptional regulator [Chryseobacterium oryzae]|uniref:Crp/Fnr family transcriptional regulator n=1 Tax=Chryseobacterium oryzae TaxID=2929799 RepID=A0ABY4BLW2_9FLAO|nr:Crp/Fnr family transcriptional regulator [Chryseobacterium oryzae]UOE38746.1 Crp/Fnr family transcriptional regulator [Chryseobacterium oryzae]
MENLLKNHIRELVDITTEEFTVIKTYFTLQNHPKKHLLVKENHPVNEMFFVADGLLKCGTMDNSGKEHILQFATQDWWITDFQGFFRQENASLDVQCLQDCVLFAISFENFESLCRDIPKMEHFFRVKSNLGYVALQRRIMSLMSDTAKERYEAFLRQYPNLFQRISKQTLANYLGVTRETLSRLQF